MTTFFSDIDKNDLREFYRIYDFAKVESVDRIVETCIAHGTTPQQLFNDLYSLHHVASLPDREEATRRLRDAVPMATEADIESALRQSEIKGFTASDAMRALQRRMGTRRTLNTSLEPTLKELHSTTTLERSRPLSSGRTREAMDAIMAEECREWVAKVVGDAYNAEVLRETNFVDALRGGVVLLVLLQKLQDPPVSDDALRVPKRVTGFYGRDNVVSFLKQAASTYQLVEAQLFTDSDLCDGKNDRAVVTCLLSIARIAYMRGSTKFAPSMVIYEQEIDAKLKSFTQQQIDDMLLEIEASDVNSEASDETTEEQHVDMCQGQVYTSPSLALTTFKEIPEVKLNTVVEKVEVNDTVQVEINEKPVNLFIEEEENKEVTITSSTTTTGGATEDDEERIMKGVRGTPRGEAKSLEKSETILCSHDVAIQKDSQNMVSVTNTISSVSSNLKLKSDSVKKSPIAVEAPKYYPRRSDEIDLIFSVIVNAHFHMYPHSQVRFHRLSSCAGEYIVYHRSAGHKRLVYARVVQGQLLIRQQGRFSGGAPTWENLKHWLERYEDEFKA